MEGFRIDTSDEKISSVSRTIRIKAETFDKINEINMKTGVSFNKIVNQCIEYALKNYEEQKKDWDEMVGRSDVGIVVTDRECPKNSISKPDVGTGCGVGTERE
mgnify:CR=1 FL=1